MIKKFKIFLKKIKIFENVQLAMFLNMLYMHFDCNLLGFPKYIYAVKTVNFKKKLGVLRILLNRFRVI
jgi:hypothetical protein